MRAVGRRRETGIDATRRARFERLFSDAYEPLQRYVRRRASATDADDVVADALLVAWRRLDDVPDEASVAWMYGVARNCLANRRRSAVRAERLALRVADAARTEAVNSPGADDRLRGVTGAASGIEDAVLEESIAQLTDTDREVLRLWAWEQLTAAEIGVALGISANAASIRLHRAKLHLAELVAGRRKPATADGHSSSEHREEGER